MNGGDRSENVARKRIQIKFAVIGTDHKESVRIQEFCAFSNERHQMLTHVKIKALEARKARRVKYDTIKAEALLDSPTHIFNRITAEEFTWTQIEAIQGVIFTTLVKNFSADIGVCRHRGTA